MLKILKLLNEKKDLIKGYEIIEFKFGENFYLLKIKCLLKDKSLLFIREFLKGEDKKYSYHWQDSKGRMFYRWDNAPYHKNIETFPHHMHYRDKVVKSNLTDFEEILNFIENKIQQRK